MQKWTCHCSASARCLAKTFNVLAAAGWRLGLPRLPLPPSALLGSSGRHDLLIRDLPKIHSCQGVRLRAALCWLAIWVPLCSPELERRGLRQNS